MPTRSLLSLLVAASAFAAGPTSPQAYPGPSTGTNSASLTAVPVTARIFKPITLTGVTGLDFGAMVQTDPTLASDLTFTPGTTAGAFTTASTNLTTFTSTGVTPSVAQITATGSKSKAVNITLGATTVTLTGSISGTMTVNPMKIAASGNASADYSGTAIAGAFDASGNTFINVGGKLNIGANQSEGTYTGSFDITVAYQ